MTYAVCCVPVSPLRIEPSHKSEMVSQQLFGECCLVIETAPGNWVKIKCNYDHYEGWCQSSHLAEIDERDYGKPEKELTAEWVNLLDYNGHPMHVPMGSSLTALRNGDAFWKKKFVHYSGEVWDPSGVQINTKVLTRLAYKYLNTPYLWGGKSVFGIDCSGFVQGLYKFFNIPLPRDAYQQIGHGEAIGFLQEGVCGDLAFFDNEEGRITHVGMLLNSNEIIHSSGKVRIDRIDNQGILNLETGTRTHTLRIIKRYF
ncbi:MAG: C40 family peptidase [Chitinophagaceae bacterium]